jgi:hypothetical protein
MHVLVPGRVSKRSLRQPAAAASAALLFDIIHGHTFYSHNRNSRLRHSWSYSAGLLPHQACTRSAAELQQCQRQLGHFYYTTPGAEIHSHHQRL